MQKYLVEVELAEDVAVDVVVYHSLGRYHHQVLHVAAPTVLALLPRPQDLCLHVALLGALLLVVAHEGGSAGGAAAAQTGHTCEAVLSKEVDVGVELLSEFQVPHHILVSMGNRVWRVDVGLGQGLCLPFAESSHLHERVYDF